MFFYKASWWFLLAFQNIVKLCVPNTWSLSAELLKVCLSMYFNKKTYNLINYLDVSL